MHTLNKRFYHTQLFFSREHTFVNRICEKFSPINNSIYLGGTMNLLTVFPPCKAYFFTTTFRENAL